MNKKGHADESAGGNETGNRSEGHASPITAENLVELCPHPKVLVDD